MVGALIERLKIIAATTLHATFEDSQRARERDDVIEAARLLERYEPRPAAMADHRDGEGRQFSEHRKPSGTQGTHRAPSPSNTAWAREEAERRVVNAAQFLRIAGGKFEGRYQVMAWSELCRALDALSTLASGGSKEGEGR